MLSSCDDFFGRRKPPTDSTLFRKVVWRHAYHNESANEFRKLVSIFDAVQTKIRSVVVPFFDLEWENGRQ